MNMNKELAIKKVSRVGVFANLFLLAIKFIVGFMSKSQALIADAINSAGDIFASCVSLIGIKVATKPKDANHPYGHGKAEYIFSSLVGLSMIIAAFIMIKNSILSIINKDIIEVSIWIVIVCITTIITKFILMIYARYYYKKYNSILIKSSIEDHRNYIFVTFGVLISIVFSYFNIYYVDAIAGIIISIWIICAGIKIIYSSSMVLMDTQWDFTQEAKCEILKFSEVLNIDKFNTKPVGDSYIAIIEVAMKKDKSLEEVHEVLEKIEERLKSKFEMLHEVNIHVNPK